MTAVPALEWGRHYQRSWLSRDVVGGLAAGSVVIPQAMAYATIADLPVEVGLYTCLVPMLVYAALGGSRTLSVSTTSTVAVLTGSTLISADVAASSDDPARALATLTVLVGLILLVARLLKLGSLVDNISAATLTGIKAGVGLTVAAGQLPKLLGVAGDPDADAFFGEVAGVIDDLAEISWTTVGLSAATIAVLVLLARFAPGVPAPLIGVAGGIAAVAILSLDEHGIALIAPVPSGLPLPIVPDPGHVDALLGGSIAIALMCFMETASVAGAVRRREEPAIDNDQELVANGLACVLGGLFRSMPAAGGFSQTAINVRSGARTQVSALVTVLLAVACALFLGGVLSDLPQATLGALVVVAVLGLIEIDEFVRYWRFDRISFAVAAGTALAGLWFGLLAAVLIGVVLTLFLALRELNTVRVFEVQPTAAGDDVVIARHGEPVPGLLVLRVDAPLYTANVGVVVRHVRDRVTDDAPSVVVLDLSAMTALSITVADELGELRTSLAVEGVEVWFAGLPPRALEVAERLPAWSELDRAGALHETSLAAIRAHQSRF